MMMVVTLVGFVCRSGWGWSEIELARGMKREGRGKSDRELVLGSLLLLLLLPRTAGGCSVAGFGSSTWGKGQSYVRLRRTGLHSDSQCCFEG